MGHVPCSTGKEARQSCEEDMAGGGVSRYSACHASMRACVDPAQCASVSLVMVGWGEQSQAASQRLLAGQPSQLVNLGFAERPPSQKLRWRRIKEDTEHRLASTHMHRWVHPWTHTHNTDKHTQRHIYGYKTHGWCGRLETQLRQVKRLWRKHEELSSRPSTHLKARQSGVVCNPSPGEVKTGGSMEFAHQTA